MLEVTNPLLQRLPPRSRGISTFFEPFVEIDHLTVPPHMGAKDNLTPRTCQNSYTRKEANETRRTGRQTMDSTDQQRAVE